jgi:hypothetical protein
MLESMLVPRIRSAISQYTAKHLDELGEDRLLPADWQNLEDIATFLKKFQAITKVTEGRNASLADVLPAIDFLLDAFSQELTKAEGTGNLALAAMVKCGWQTLDKYFSLTDRAPVYVAAVVLHPKRTWQYFQLRWKEEWLPPPRRRSRSCGQWAQPPCPKKPGPAGWSIYVSQPAGLKIESSADHSGGADSAGPSVKMISWCPQDATGRCARERGPPSQRNRFLTSFPIGRQRNVRIHASR